MGSVASPSPTAHTYRHPTVESSMLGTPAFHSTMPFERQESLREDQEDDHEDDNSEADFDIEDYSLDLDKLGGKSTGALIEHRSPQRLALPSEEGGPEDFTLHLRDYINGVLPKKAATQKTEATIENQGSLQAPTQRPPVFAAQDDQSQHEPRNASSDAGSEHGHCHKEFSTAQQNNNFPIHHQRIMPPISRRNTEGRLDEAADEIFDRITALQIEIEKLRVESEQTRASNQELSEQCSIIKDERSLLKGELSEVRHQVQQSEARESRAHERVMALEHARSSDEVKELKSLRANNERLISELEGTKAEAKTQKTSLQERISELKSDLQKAKDDLNIRQEPPAPLADSDTPDLAKEVSELRIRNQTLEASITASRNELESAMSQLRDTRNWASDLEEENGRLAQQNVGMTQDNEEIADVLEQKSAQLSAAQTTVAELRQTLHHAAEETPSPPTSRFRELQDEALAQADAEHDDTIQALEKNHAAEVKQLKSIILKAGRGMQKREAKLTAEKSKEILDLEGQIKTLRSQIAQYEARTSAQPKQVPEDDTAIRNERDSKLRFTANTVSSLRTTNATLEESIIGLQSEVNSLRANNQDMAEKLVMEREDYEAVNKDFNTQILATMKIRDAKWKSKIHKFKEENELMGKTLLMMWGREECGVSAGGREGKKSAKDVPDKQRYIYRFKEMAKVPEA